MSQKGPYQNHRGVRTYSRELAPVFVVHLDGGLFLHAEALFAEAVHQSSAVYPLQVPKARIAVNGETRFPYYVA